MKPEAGVVERLRAARVLPVVTVAEAGHGRLVGEALLAGGVPCIELAFRTPAAAQAIASAREVEGLLVGAGTVLSVESLKAAVDAGAEFAVAPGTNDEIVQAAADLGVPFFPGVATATEIDHARRLGARTLKVFPATQVGGPAFLQAVSATYPDVGFIPTGGIRPTNLAEYLAVGSVVACGGTWIAPQALVPDRLGEIEQLARQAAAAAS